MAIQLMILVKGNQDHALLRATSILYISIHTHRTNRQRQSLQLHQQSLALNYLTDPNNSSKTRPEELNILRQPVAERERLRLENMARWRRENGNLGRDGADWEGLAKERWNRGVQGVAKWVEGIDLGLLRERVEDVARAGWRSLGGSR